MSPWRRKDGQTNKQTSEDRATQSVDTVRLSFAIPERILNIKHNSAVTVTVTVTVILLSVTSFKIGQNHC